MVSTDYEVLKYFAIKWRLLFLAIWFIFLDCASAEMLPCFDMVMLSDKAHRIVIAEVDQDGILSVELVINVSSVLPADQMKLDNAIAKKLRTAMGLKQNDKLRIAAFLDELNNPVWGDAGIVGLDDKCVWMCQDSYRDSTRYTENDTYTADSFTKEVRRVLEVIEKRHELSDLPPSTERVEKIVEFLRDKSDYHLRQLVSESGSFEPQEENRLLEILKVSENSDEISVILSLARQIPFRPRSYDNILPYLDVKQSPDIRRKAIAALPEIDMSRIAVSFGPFLNIEEPELHTFLTYLKASSGKSVSNSPDIRVIGPLLRLVSDFREYCAEHDRNELANVGYAILGSIDSYAHPKFIPLLIEWAMNENHVTSNQALSTLQSLTGLSYGRDQKDKWARWLAGSSAVLLDDYNLTSEEGRAKWISPWNQSDATTQKLLLRIWLFEAKIQEDALLALTSDSDHAKSEAVKFVLSELWQHERLSLDCHKNLVVQFLNLSLVQHPSQIQGQRHLYIVADPQFPFPRDSWVQPQCVWSMTSDKPELGNSYGAFSLHDVRDIVVGSLSGSVKDNCMVTAILEIREVSRGTSDNVLWSHQWIFGPSEAKSILYVKQDSR